MTIELLHFKLDLIKKKIIELEKNKHENAELIKQMEQKRYLLELEINSLMMIK